MDPEITWAHSALRPRLWRLDARAVFPVLLWLVHWSWWTLGLALSGILALALTDLAGLPPGDCLARLRSILVGSLRPATDPAALRRRAHW
jgi:intracellular multiplication protein IcmT